MPEDIISQIQQTKRLNCVWPTQLWFVIIKCLYLVQVLVSMIWCNRGPYLEIENAIKHFKDSIITVKWDAKVVMMIFLAA